MMEWTKEKPTISGYYWPRNDLTKHDQENGFEPDPKKAIVKYCAKDRFTSEEEIYFCGNEVRTMVSDFVSAEWAGPIEPPK